MAKKFRPIGEAVGALVMAGFGVRTKTERVAGWNSMCLFVEVTTAGDEPVYINTFRDGATYAIKWESVQDLLDTQKPPASYKIVKV